jgi:spermidine/putrescine transport system permease protein
VFNTDYLGIFQRSFWLSILTTLGCLLIGYPTALYLALQDERRRNLLLFLVTVPFWTNLLVRVYAWILLLRNGGWSTRACTPWASATPPSACCTPTRP